MKKIAFTMASMLVATGAMAAGENATLTTKNYVDSGLRAVYQKAQSAETKAEAAKSVADANATAIQNLQTAIEGVDYSGKADQADLNALSETVAGHTTAISGLETSVAGKADASTVSALSETVAGKADASTVSALSGTVDQHTTAINNLQSTVEGLNDSDTTYTAGTGIAIDTANNNAIGLSVPAAAANDGNAYVYKNGAWTALDVEDTWDASILTSGN